ncbi:helix-turn-helix domain-containing protein [Yinghuangia soli]|uniref:XRE family transcriptional regulator n=1 Tax=Yinghuangia soli TaxID=2908204 RepID=A0AA41U1N1_9ACTN|nr:XRE family transcriptional regulator [Yinghuangia soli]MCF2526289.1 XRE family transcriptional regulator [Yinghuangia soli]
MDLGKVGERVRRAREASRYTQRELAPLAGLSQPTLARIEAGTRSRVTLAELDRIAEVLEVSLRELTQGSSVRSRVVVAARMADVDEATREAALGAVVDLLVLDDRMDRAGASRVGTDEAGRRDGLTTAPVDLPDSALPPEDQGARLAKAVRDRLDLAGAPITDAAELLERLTGADTAVLDLPEGVDGFSVADPERGVLVVALATSSSPERQRFTSCHELGHVLFGDCAEAHRTDGDCTPKERRCDAFARHLLAPTDGIAAWLRPLEGGGSGAAAVPEPDLRTCALLARHFRVSLPVVLFQLRAMGLLTTARVQALRGQTGAQLAQRFGWGPQYLAERDAALRPKPPRRILERAVQAYTEGRVGVRVVARLAGEGVGEVQARLDDAGLTPAPQQVRRAAVSDLLARAQHKG